MYGPGIPYHPFYTCGAHWYDLFLVVNLKAVDQRLGFSNRSTSEAYDSSTMSESSLILIALSSERVLLLGPSVLAFHDAPAKKGEACPSHLRITTTFLSLVVSRERETQHPLLQLETLSCYIFFSLLLFHCSNHFSKVDRTPDSLSNYLLSFGSIFLKKGIFCCFSCIKPQQCRSLMTS